MKIAIDVSPLTTGHYLSHRVRGTGFYLTNLRDFLKKHFPKNDYYFFSRGEDIPSADIVHYPYFEPFFITLPQAASGRYVVTVHDLTPLVFPKHFPSGIKGKLKWQIQKRALKKAARIITDSESSKKDIVSYAGIDASKIDVVYLAAGEGFKKQNVKTGTQLPEKYLLYVGDVTWNKNLPRIVEAVKKTKYPLVMVGKALIDENFDTSNPWNSDLSKVQKETKEDKQFIKLGFVSNEELVALYNNASALVMPSLYEGFGLPILEAMASGCAVVTAKNGSVPEVAGDAAFYVDANSSESIAEGINKVMGDDSLRERLSKKGIEQARKFSWKKTAEETLKVYEKAISK